MSVLVTMRVSGDTEQFRGFVETDGDFMRRLGEEAKAQGAIHHRFGVGDGFVMVVDEWESADAFQRFFQHDDIAQAILRAGAQGSPKSLSPKQLRRPTSSEGRSRFVRAASARTRSGPRSAAG